MLALTAGCSARPNQAEPRSCASEDERARLLCTSGWSAAQPLRFLVVGDTQNTGLRGSQNQAPRTAIYRRFVQAMADSVPAFHVGDLVAKGGCRAHWERFFDAIFWDDLSVQLRGRFYPVPGNHEYKTHLLDYGGGDLRHYHARFPHLSGFTYYYMVHQDAAFICMDSGRNGIIKLLRGERWQNVADDQLEWLHQVVFPALRNGIAAGQIRRIFLFFHKSAYTVPGHVSNTESAAMLDRFAALACGAGQRLDIVAFTGHIHTFSHIRHRSAVCNEACVEQFTVGTGGGVQHGAEYYGELATSSSLDLYRAEKYHRISEAPFGHDALAAVCRDNTHFGFVDVTAGDSLVVRYMRYERRTGVFEMDYEFIR